jgi:hypothetical protein
MSNERSERRGDGIRFEWTDDQGRRWRHDFTDDELAKLERTGSVSTASPPEVWSVDDQRAQIHAEQAQIEKRIADIDREVEKLEGEE